MRSLISFWLLPLFACLAALLLLFVVAGVVVVAVVAIAVECRWSCLTITHYEANVNYVASALMQVISGQFFCCCGCGLRSWFWWWFVVVVAVVVVVVVVVVVMVFGCGRGCGCCLGCGCFVAVLFDCFVAGFFIASLEFT